MNKLTDFATGLPGIIFDYAGSTAPSGFFLCYGQAVSRTTYAALFGVTGTTFGVGDGSTTFNVPDLRGVVAAGVGNMGGTASGKLGVSTTGTTTAASAVVTAIPTTAALAVGMLAIGGALPVGITIASIDSATQVTLSTGTSVTAATAGAIRFCLIDAHTLGATGGVATHTLSAAEMPAHTHTLASISGAAGSTNRSPSSGGGLTDTTSSTGGGNAHSVLQPTIVLNKIIKY